MAFDADEERSHAPVTAPASNQRFSVSILCEAAKFRFIPFFERLMPMSIITDIKKAAVKLQSFHGDVLNQLEANQKAWGTYEHVSSLIFISNEYSGVSQYVSDVDLVLHDKLVHLPPSVLKQLAREISQATDLVSLKLPVDVPLVAGADAVFNESSSDFTLEQQPAVGAFVNADDSDPIVPATQNDFQGSMLASGVASDNEGSSASDNENAGVGNDMDREASSASSSVQEVSAEAVAALTNDKLLDLFLSYHTAFNNAVFAECQQLIAPDGMSDVDNGDDLQCANDAEKNKMWEQFFRDVPAECVDGARHAFNKRWVPFNEGEIETDLKKSAVLRGEKLGRKASRRHRSIDGDDSDGEAGEYNAAVVREYRGREFRGRVTGTRIAGEAPSTGDDDSSDSLSGTTESDSDGDDKSGEKKDNPSKSDAEQLKKSRKRKRKRKSSSVCTPDDDDKKDVLKKRKRRRSSGSAAKSPLAFGDDADSKPPSVKSTGSECLFLEQKSSPQKTTSPLKTEGASADENGDDVEVISQTFHPMFGHDRSSTTKKRYQQNAKKRGRNIRKKYAGVDAATKRVMRETKKHNRLMNEKRVRIAGRFGDDSGVLDMIEPDSQLLVDACSSQQKNFLVSVDEGLWKCLMRHQKAGVRFMYDAVVGSIDVPDDFSRDDMEGCILAHQMGLGKTLQSFTIADTFYHDQDIPVRKILVLTPLNNRDNWENEIKIWSMKCSTCTGTPNDPLKFQVVRGSTHEQLAPLLNWTDGVIIMHYPLFIQVYKLTQTTPLCESYANVNRKVKKTFANNPNLVQKLKEKLLFGPDLVILDEAHALKSENTQVYRSVAALRTPAKIALTGTPLQNNLMEYYALIQLVSFIQAFVSFFYCILNGKSFF